MSLRCKSVKEVSLSESQPSRGLSRERIAAAALDLIEKEGLEAFSTRKLAEVLGCQAMSIYHHFPSKAHLMDALVDRVLGEARPVPEGSWRERLEFLARDYRRLALAYPRFYGFLALHRLNTRGGLAFLERVTAVFREAGLDDLTAAALFRCFGYYLLGAAMDETAGYSKGPSTVEPIPPEIFVRDYPDIAAFGPYFGPERFEATFNLGLAILLEGAERIRAAGGA